MARYLFKTDEKSEAYCDLIAQEMARFSHISESEAIQRINKTWAHVPKIVGDQELIYHEDEKYWARTIYYGKSSCWWLNETNRAKNGFPPLSPLPLD